MEEIITAIKNWLGTGSVNIFGLPMSGKDTQGVRLAEAIGGKFLSSGMIIHAANEQNQTNFSNDGTLAPTDVFYDLVLPYFNLEELKPFPLVLSSIGRWSGEENAVMESAENSGHEIKAAIVLNVSEAEIMERWDESHTLGDRGERPDDMKPEVFQTRIQEFREKTLPVLQHYRELGKLVEVSASASRDEVFSNLIEQLYKFSKNH